MEDAGPQPEVTDATPRSHAVVFNITGGSVKDGMDDNDEDLLHMARIQNGMSPAERPLALLLQSSSLQRGNHNH